MKILSLNFCSNYIGENKDNLKYLVNTIQNLPNLLDLKLILSANNLGENIENFK